MWINTGQNENGISQVYSLREIATGNRLEYDLNCIAKFGQYAYVHIYPDTTDGMQNRTFPDIFLGPTANMQGTVKVIDIVESTLSKG